MKLISSITLQLADAAAAPAPSANVPACCPTTSVQQGDTVNSLLTAAGLQASGSPTSSAPEVQQPGMYSGMHMGSMHSSIFNTRTDICLIFILTRLCCAADAAALFYAFNPSTQNGTALIPGTTVTLPCYRIMEYIKEKAPAAPTPGAEPV